jgi:hypothetical protein
LRFDDLRLDALLDLFYVVDDLRLDVVDLRLDDLRLDVDVL